VGLLRAAERFDARFSVRFRTYAAHWIKQAIRHALKTTAATIRVPEHLADLVCRWQRLEGRLELAEGRRPQPERIAEALGLTPAQFKLVQLALASRTSRRAGAFRLEEGWPWGDPVDSGYEPPDAMLAIAEEREILTARLAKLSDSERIVLALRFGLDGQPRLTQKEAGRRLGLPRVDVRKLESQALKRIGAGWSRPIEAVRAVREIRCAAGLRPAGVEGRQRGSFRFLG
jgi:RNA polymerase primary sigma factor